MLPSSDFLLNSRFMVSFSGTSFSFAHYEDDIFSIISVGASPVIDHYVE